MVILSYTGAGFTGPILDLAKSSMSSVIAKFVAIKLSISHNLRATVSHDVLTPLIRSLIHVHTGDTKGARCFDTSWPGWLRQGNQIRVSRPRVSSQRSFRVPLPRRYKSTFPISDGAIKMISAIGARWNASRATVSVKASLCASTEQTSTSSESFCTSMAI